MVILVVLRSRDTVNHPGKLMKNTPVVRNPTFWITALSLVVVLLGILNEVLRMPSVSERIDGWLGRVSETPRPESAVISVSVDREDQTYLDGEPMTVTVTSDRAGYVYLFSSQQEKANLLFPATPELSNSIAATKKFRWSTTAGQPDGKRTLHAIVTHSPMTESELKGDAPDPLALRSSQIEELRECLKARDASGGWQWAETSVTIEVINPGR